MPADLLFPFNEKRLLVSEQCRWYSPTSIKEHGSSCRPPDKGTYLSVVKQTFCEMEEDICPSQRRSAEKSPAAPPIHKHSNHLESPRNRRREIWGWLLRISNKSTRYATDRRWPNVSGLASSTTFIAFASIPAPFVRPLARRRPCAWQKTSTTPTAAAGKDTTSAGSAQRRPSPGPVARTSRAPACSAGTADASPADGASTSRRRCPRPNAPPSPATGICTGSVCSARCYVGLLSDRRKPPGPVGRIPAVMWPGRTPLAVSRTHPRNLMLYSGLRAPHGIMSEIRTHCAGSRQGIPGDGGSSRIGDPPDRWRFGRGLMPSCGSGGWTTLWQSGSRSLDPIPSATASSSAS